MEKLELKQTSYGLAYNIIKQKLNGWSEYDNTIADSQLDNYGFIIVDCFNTPIDNEFDVINIVDDIERSKL